MRSTDEPTDTFGQLGQKIPPPDKPAGDTWRPTDTPHIERNQDGKLRTNLPDRSPALMSPVADYTLQGHLRSLSESEKRRRKAVLQASQHVVSEVHVNDSEG